MGVIFRGTRHFHTRKKAEKMPKRKAQSLLKKHNIDIKIHISNGRFKKFIDKSIYVIAVLAPLSTIPQVIKAWTSPDIESLSLITRGFHTINSIFRISYGYIHRERAIIISNIAWLIVNLSICLAILFHG